MGEYYGVSTPTSDFFMHYGIPGMRWGVRKYLDKNGKMTPKGNKRYGADSTKRTSARKMQRDYNNLDKSYADNRAEYIDVKRGRQFNIPTLYTAGMNKMSKQERMKVLKTQGEGIKALQNRILKMAKKNKYNVELTPKSRLGSSVRDMEFEANGGIYSVSHASAHAQDKEKYYNGNKATIRKHKR